MSPAATSGRRSSQHGRTSSARIGPRRGSAPQMPKGPAIPRRKWAQVAQLVEDREQTQHRDASGWGVPQCGQRQFAMARSVVCGSQTVRTELHACRRSTETDLGRTSVPNGSGIAERREATERRAVRPTQRIEPPRRAGRSAGWKARRRRRRSAIPASPCCPGQGPGCRPARSCRSPAGPRRSRA